MQKDSTIISLVSIVFIIVLVLTVVISVKYINEPENDFPTPDTIGTTSPTPPQQQESAQSNDINQIELKQDIIELEHIPGNDFADIYLSNSQNLSGIEFTVNLPENTQVINLSDKELFYDFIYKQNDGSVTVGAISLQVVSPKDKYRILRIFFNRPVTEEVTIASYMFLDQEGNEI